MKERTGCLIPLCRRSTGEPCDYWICRQHWTGIPSKWRKLFFAARRRYRKNPTMRNWRSEIRIWWKLVSIATDKAFP